MSELKKRVDHIHLKHSLVSIVGFFVMVILLLATVTSLESRAVEKNKFPYSIETTY